MLSTYESTEFGVPVNGTPPTKYSWLGATGATSELPSGTLIDGTVAYQPQLGRALQTQAAVPPGLAVGGATDNTTPYTSQISAWELNANNATGEADTKQYEEEVAKREAQEKAALEGNGPGEETFGDPVHCYVGGMVTIEGDQASINGYGGCNEGLPQGTWIYVCIGALSDAGPQTDAGCKHITVKHHRSRYWSIGLDGVIHCESGEIIRALVEFYVPGGKVLYAGTANGGECDAASDEIDEAALSLFYSPDASGVLELLTAFFRNTK